MFRFDLRRVLFVIIVLVVSVQIFECNPITNASFNASVRDYTVHNDNNITHVKTLQKEEKGKYAHVTAERSPVKFKEIPDNTLSGSSDSHSRGLLLHEHQGYDLNDYEEGPYHGYGHDYHYQDPHLSHHNPHVYDHHDYDHHHHPLGYHNYHHGHYKYDKHGLASKAALWPLAGIALLGAAALAVSSPILVQLGVVSGKRRRREAEDIVESSFVEDSLKKYTENVDKLNMETTSYTENSEVNNLKRKLKTPDSLFKELTKNDKIKRRFIITNIGGNRRPNIKGYNKPAQSAIDQSTESPRVYDKSYEGGTFIPIPIKIRSPNVSEPRPKNI